MDRWSTRTPAAASALAACFALATWGCGDSEAKSAPGDDGGSPAAEDGGSTDPWKPLLKGEWTLGAGVEDYVCVRQTITEDTYIRGVQAINPPGTHHTFLTIGESTGPDGVTPCEVTTNHTQSIFGSGVGTNPIEFPEGVAMKLTAGQQLLLNLHLFNTDTSELSGTSGTKILPVEEGEFEYLGDNRPALTLDLNIPPQQVSSKAATTKTPADTTLFAVLPHMHQLGAHAKVVAVSSIEGERLLHDADYDFDAQLYYPVEPIRMAKGDEVRFECTWNNTTDRTVVFGDSSTDEMCAIGLYGYPAP